MPLTSFTQIVNYASSTETISALSAYLSMPLLSVVFAVVVVVAGLGLVASMVFWLGRKIANLGHHDEPPHRTRGRIIDVPGGKDVDWY